MSLDKKNNYTSEEDAAESIQGDSTSLNTSQSKWEKFLDFIAVQEKGDLTTVQMFLYNHDLRPVEKERRAWSWYNFVFFWVADSFNVNTWQIAATGVQNGMTWWQTWLSVWVGYILCGIFVTLGARIGVLYHISFPVAARSSFGIYGSLWPILNRVVMSAVWYSVQGWIGGQCVQLMLLSIFHNADKKLDTPLQGGADVLTTFKFLGYFLFWLFSLPAIWFPPHQIRHLFTFKAYVVPFAGIGFLIWTLVKAKGAGPVIHEKSSKHGSELGWLFIESTLNSLANFATLIVNAPDFARFSDRPSFGIKYLVHTVSIPLCFSITSLIGILVSSASTILYDETLWSPLDVLGRFLDNYTLGNRAGVFFISTAFALAQLGTNISANSLSFGTDCTAMLPRFINIRRGGYICAALALCICPWNLMTSSSMFTTYLSAYSVFLSSIAGVVACDYFYIRRGYIKLTHLYSLHAPEQPSAPSFYKFGRIGVNWRAYVAYICGILPNIVGFVGATETHKVPIGATEVYRLSFIMGFFSAFIIYALLNFFSPVAGIPPVKPFEKGWFEEWQEVEDFEEELQGHIMPQTSALENTLSYEGGRHRKTATEF